MLIINYAFNCFINYAFSKLLDDYRKNLLLLLKR